METSKKITLATIKKFIRENKDNLFIKVKSDYDAMSDCYDAVDNPTLRKVTFDENSKCEHDLGVAGAWFVFDSRDYFREIENENYKGYNVTNCCTSFELLTSKN
ncbi:MAG TPA: hypothetical protein PLQ36_01430 [Candidatus Gracilibacteria bacterium]|nr:hypothetical protein [Candidatus Gracilibacteria bacterium]